MIHFDTYRLYENDLCRLLDSARILVRDRAEALREDSSTFQIGLERPQLNTKCGLSTTKPLYEKICGGVSSQLACINGIIFQQQNEIISIQLLIMISMDFENIE